MTIKDNRAGKHKLHKADLPGKLAATVLSYRKAISTTLSMPDSLTPSATLKASQTQKILCEIARSNIRRLRSATALLDKLESIMSNRQSTPCTDRAMEYFRDVFPYADIPICKSDSFNMLPYRDKQRGIIIDDISNVLRAIEAAEGLLMCTHFLKTSADEWPENSLFKKEREHAVNVLADELFIREREAFYAQFGHMISNKKALLRGSEALRRARKDETYNIYCGREAASQDLNRLLLSLNSKQQQMFKRLRDTFNTSQIAILESLLDTAWLDAEGTPEEAFHDHLSCICENYALEGFNKTTAIARRFRLRMDGNTFTIEIPSYLKFDWKKDFPKNVIDMLRKRSGAGLTYHPKRALDCAVREETDLEIVEYLKQLISEWAANNIKTKSDVFDMVHKRFGSALSSSQGADAINAMCRRLMKRHNIRWPSRSKV